MTQNPLLQLVILIVVAWSVLSLLLKLPYGNWLIAVVVVIAAMGAVTLWMLSNRRELAKKLYARPGCRHFIDLVCKMSKQQPPADMKAEPAQILLREPADYDRAADELCLSVLGHDAVIRDMTAQLSRMYKLRMRTVTAVRKPPLGIFLLVGPEGIGKVHLAARLETLLFSRGGLFVMDMRDYRDSASASMALFGGSQGGGQLISAIRSKPLLTVVLEHCDALSADVIEQLRKSLQAGAVLDPSTGGSRVSFENCLFILTTGQCLDSMRAIAASGGDSRSFQKRAEAELAENTTLSMSLLSVVNCIHWMDRPDDVTCAAIIVMLMEMHCRNHRVTLEYVSPEVLADEVEAISPELGFQLMPKRVERLLHEPLLRAAQDDQNSITVDRAESTIDDQELIATRGS